jgi:uncharacterized protein (TIGR02118 family)
VIKVLSLLTRKPDLSHDEFVKHWRDVHGPLAHGIPGLRRYVQSHITGTRTRADIAELDIDIDGIAELWYDDAASMAAASATPEAKRLYADGALFISRIKTFVIDEQEVIPPRV